MFFLVFLDRIGGEVVIILIFVLEFYGRMYSVVYVEKGIFFLIILEIILF